MLLTGVAGPILDSFFLGGRLDRREIVATKGVCQIFGHGLKLIYFGSMVGGLQALDGAFVVAAIVATVAGAALAKPVLEVMSDKQFRNWAQVLIVSICIYYLGYGGYLFVAPR